MLAQIYGSDRPEAADVASSDNAPTAVTLD